MRLGFYLGASELTADKSLYLKLSNAHLSLHFWKTGYFRSFRKTS